MWKLKTPPLVLYCLPRVVLDQLPTRANLNKRCISLHDNNYTCPICGQFEKTTQHLLLTCYVAQRLWNYYYSWFNIQIVLPKDLKSTFLTSYYMGQREERRTCMATSVGSCFMVYIESSKMIYYLRMVSFHLMGCLICWNFQFLYFRIIFVFSHCDFMGSKLLYMVHFSPTFNPYPLQYPRISFLPW